MSAAFPRSSGRHGRGWSGRLPAALVACALLASALPLRAQTTFPARPVRLVVPYPAGGTTDILGRVVAQKLSEAWRQPVVVDNRSGASGSIGAALVAKAAPTGYTIVLGNSASHGAYELLNPGKAPYDSSRDFVPISLLAFVKQILVVHPSVDARSVKELVVLLRAKPGRFNYGSSAIGSAPQLAAELFKLVAGVDVVHIPYGGAAPAMTALLGGSVEMMFASAPTVAEHVRAGKLRGLAVASPTRSGMLPSLATMAEVGFPGVEMDSWFGLLLPAGAEPALVAQINADLHRATGGDEIAQQFGKLGFERAIGSPEAFRKLMQEERVRTARVIREAKIRPD